jgi:chemotaxis protein histidine kinase CheA
MTVLDDDALIGLILRPGFSTRANATALAGRGVGMDAVVHAVGALNGSVAVESRDGLGCTVRIAIPLPG